MKILLIIFTLLILNSCQTRNETWIRTMKAPITLIAKDNSTVLLKGVNGNTYLVNSYLAKVINLNYHINEIVFETNSFYGNEKVPSGTVVASCKFGIIIKSKENGYYYHSSDFSRGKVLVNTYKKGDKIK